MSVHSSSSKRARERELTLRREFNSASQPLLVRALLCCSASRALNPSRQARGRDGEGYGGTVDVRARRCGSAELRSRGARSGCAVSQY